MGMLTNLGLAATLILTASNASAALIYQESFEGGTLQPNTSMTGQGNDGSNGFFEILPFNPLDLAYAPTGADGSSYVGGRDLNNTFGGQSGAAQRWIDITGVDISGFTDVVLRVALSARPVNPSNGNRFEASDFIEIFAGAGLLSSLDKFTGPADGSGPLSNGSVSLGRRFQDLTYAIAPGSTLSVRVQAWTNGDAESLAIDNIRIEGTPVSEPASLALLGLGLGALGLRRRRT